MYLADSEPFREGERHTVRVRAPALVVRAGVGLDYGGKHPKCVCDALASGQRQGLPSDGGLCTASSEAWSLLDPTASCPRVWAMPSQNAQG